MQVQKKEIRDKILEYSFNHFYNQGFINTSMRQISKDCGMSVGNLYKYFDSKDDLFDEIVSDYYKNYIYNLMNFLSHEKKDETSDNSVKMLALSIFNSIKDNYKIFVILMENSKGTKYENFKDYLVLSLESHIKKEKIIPIHHDYILKVFSRNFFNGILDIAKNYQNDEFAYKNILLLAQYHLKGISILFQ